MSWHRGGAELAQSASAAAFAAAADHHASWIEVDVRRSADGVLVCVHDETLGTLGRVDQLVVARLETSNRPLSFEAFLDLLDEHDPDRHCGIHLDLKAEGYETSAADLVTSRGRRQFATSTSRTSISRLRRERPDVEALLTIGTSRQNKGPLAIAVLRLREMFPMFDVRRTKANGIAVYHRLATPFVRKWCRRRGLRIVVWTVDNDKWLAIWMQRDVDVVTTNRLLLALSLSD